MSTKLPLPTPYHDKDNVSSFPTRYLYGWSWKKTTDAIYERMNALLKKLDKIIDLLLQDREDRKAEAEAKKQEREEKLRAEKEKLLVEYAIKHNKRQPTGGVWNGREAQDKPINSGGELIPVNLSAADKELLRQFYDT